MAGTTINDHYSIGMINSQIFLKVTITNTQISRSTVRLNKQLVGEYNDSFEILLGNANDLLGSLLYVVTTESDIDPDCDSTSFSLELSGGPNPYINSRHQTVSRGGYTLYNAEIILIP